MNSSSGSTSQQNIKDSSKTETKRGNRFNDLVAAITQGRVSDPVDPAVPADSYVAILPSERDDEEEFETEPLKHPQGFSLRFHYTPKSYIEYAIAQKAVADLCGEMDYVNSFSVRSVQVGLLKQQDVIAQGIACTKTKDGLVTISMSTDPDTGIYSLVFHGYNKSGVKQLAKKYRNLCTSSNFFRGQHLSAGHPNQTPPLKFLEIPKTPKVYGFKEIQESLVTNTTGFFNCKKVHAVTPHWGILLHGIPGSGKSSLVNKTKGEMLAMGVTVIDLDSEAMNHVAYWYSIIEGWLAPAFVVLEDFDLIGQSREMGRSPEAVTTDLLASLNGNQKRKLPIVTMATTNRLSALDGAVIRARRMDKIYEISGLALEFKIQLFKQKGLTLSDKSLEDAAATIGKNGTGADVEEISASTIIYQSVGMSQEGAFKKALDEWDSAHAVKRGRLGFGNVEDGDD